MKLVSNRKPGDVFKVDVYNRKDELIEKQVQVQCVEKPKFKNSGISFPCGSSGPWVRYKGELYCVYGDWTIQIS